MSFSRASCVPQLPLHLSLSPLLAGVASDVLSTDIPDILAPATAAPPKVTGSSAYLSARQKPSSTARVTIPPREVIRLLNLLEGVEDDVACEVQRVKDSISEARELVREFKEERRVREQQFMERREREQKETKWIGDDFWQEV
ncbi:hypothetical protein WOLCODRAFT_138527 [Wolfiporia cocos MD-104 SS10]|uniref:Clathrin light chain n=1 Tax=Wolfiporia cocos (strain MD-104) TaxID=742152 RepID=A0A2H3K3U4_WOLCO|nr:hypothetical protein WOLCODRAFT_138527 [Wolfiporia cocos MD-104 SS10]